MVGDALLVTNVGPDVAENLGKLALKPGLVEAPAGQASNWLYTKPGEKWFPWFRVYGPEKAIFDKSWKLPDIEKIT